MRFTPRTILLTLAILIGAIVAHDLVRPVEKQLTTNAAILAIERYQQYVSTRIGGFVQCRFQPTCSVYGLEAVKRYGAIVGGSKALWRVIRCGPWTEPGTVDELD